MYAQQLETWHRHVGSRLHVLQYEQAREDPQTAVDRVWRQLGHDPVAVEHPDRPSRTARGEVAWSVDDVPGLRDELVHAYAPAGPTCRSVGDRPLPVAQPADSAATPLVGLALRRCPAVRWHMAPRGGEPAHRDHVRRAVDVAKSRRD